MQGDRYCRGRPNSVFQQPHVFATVQVRRERRYMPFDVDRGYSLEPSMTRNPEVDDSRYRLSTETFAEQNLVKASTVIKRVCITGSYHGVRPCKLANRRLLWPDVIVSYAGSLPKRQIDEPTTRECNGATKGADV